MRVTVAVSLMRVRVPAKEDGGFLCLRVPRKHHLQGGL